VRTLILAAAAMLSACSDRAEGLERQYDLLKRNDATPAELCAKAREVVDAHLAAEDEGKFRLWSLTASADCSGAMVDRL
jgi:hypothetical protein